MKREQLNLEICEVLPCRIVVHRRSASSRPERSPLEKGLREGDRPVRALGLCVCVRRVVDESSCLGLQLKVGGKFHLRLNMGGRPIANKYREGKMQRTLKRELKSA